MPARATLTLLLAAVLAGLPVLAPARDGATAPSVRVLPFAQQIDLGAVREVVATAPTALAATIGRHGVDVRVVPVDGAASNHALAGLPHASAEQLRHAEFREGYEGRLVLRSAQCPGLERDTIVVLATASTWTVIHKFVHAHLRPLPGCVEHPDLELRFALALHRLNVYQRRLDADGARLLDPRWRRDILAAQLDVSELLFDRIRIGQSQEAIAEKLLGDLIDERSPHFDAQRREGGRRYGEAMIDNAIDVFNAVNRSVVDTLQTVRELHRAQRDDAAAGPGGGAALSDDDVDAFESTSRVVAVRLARVHDELLALKRFYVGDQRW